jgi:tetratricopeptide (TPR) repeat protein
MADWFRRKTWTEIDEEEFFAKLGRARKDGRGQYLKIQAIELAETQDNELLNVAETLLVKLLTDYPDDNFNKSSAFQILGDIYKMKTNFEKAIDFYKKAIDFEKIFPNVKTQAYLDYSELVVKSGNIDLFDELENILLERYSGLLFPTEKYKVNSILSIINKYKGRQEQAKHFAELAEQNANSDTSGFRYHKYLGVVTERDTWLDKLVRQK